MVCVSVMYGNTQGKRFNHDYYNQKHIPLVKDLLTSSGLLRCEVDQGLAGGAPGAPAPFVCIGRLYFNTLPEFQQAFAAHGVALRNDVPNYTDIEPQLQISQMA